MGTFPPRCVGCSEPSLYTVLLAQGSDDGRARYYLPNQHARGEQGTGIDPVRATPFCKACMREVEDALRDKIGALQHRHGVEARLYDE